ILSNIPSDVSLPALFQHCQKYGEVSGVHCKLEEGNATVEFTNRQSAIAMMAEPVLGHPEIQVKWQVTTGWCPLSDAPNERTWRQGGGGRGGYREGGGKGFRQQQPRHAGNLVLENAEHQHQRAAREAKQAQEMQRVAVLSRMSETVKQLLSKLTDEKTSEAQREMCKKMLEKVKEQMHALSEDMQKEKAEKAKARDAAIRARYAGMQALQKNQSKESQDRMTLDNRPRAVLLEEMDSDFDSVPVVMEYFRVLDVKGVRDFIWREDSCIVRFESRWAAEEFVKQSTKYPFKCSYLANETADAAAKVTEPTQPLPPEAGAVIGAEVEGIPEDDEQPAVEQEGGGDQQQDDEPQQQAEVMEVGEDEDRPAHLESTDLKKLRVPLDRLFDRAVPSANSSAPSRLFDRAVPSANSSAPSRLFDRYMTGPEGKWLEEVRKVAKLESIKYCDYGKERFIVLLAASSVSLEDGRLCLETHASYYDVHNQMAELERKDPRLKPSESKR
ncbi:hypothetical protein FOZ63_025588, partial [Perkinsus olseni]